MNEPANRAFAGLNFHAIASLDYVCAGCGETIPRCTEYVRNAWVAGDRFHPGCWGSDIRSRQRSQAG